MFSRIRKWRKMTWVLYGWCALFAVWMIGGAASAQSDADCGAERTRELQGLCQDASDVGTGIGLALVGTLGFMGFVALSLIWFMTRPRKVVYVDGKA
jgi:hypothetical protein